MLEKTFTEETYTLEILYHVGTYENSIHFIFDHASKTCAIIDPAWEADLFIQKNHRQRLYTHRYLANPLAQ